MTLLQIDKRAVTAKEGQELIDRTRLIDDPFGVPTIHINKAEIEQGMALLEQPRKKSLLLGLFPQLLDDNPETEIINTKLKKLLNSSALSNMNFVERAILATEFRSHFSAVLKNDKGIKTELNQTYPLRLEGFDNSADTYERDVYRDPLGNTTFCAGEDHVFQFSQAATMAALKNADKFYPLWHEIAHGTGAGEPQADFMAAIVTRQAFAPSHVIKIWADERVLNTVLGFRDSKNIGKYGWGCVDVNDYVAALPEDRISGLDEDQIKNLRFNRFDTLAKTVFEVGSSMRTIVPSSKQSVHLMDIAQEAKYLATTKFKDDDVSRYVCQRFAMACVRTSIGYGAYSGPALELPKGKYPSFVDEPEI